MEKSISNANLSRLSNTSREMDCSSDAFPDTGIEIRNHWQVPDYLALRLS